ncbi:MAG: LamG-like jellyroll fold domain-containing protein [Opitutaceae bacterium]
MKKTFSFSVLTFFFLFAFSQLNANSVLYVPRTIDTDTSSNDWDNGTEQRGGLAVSLEYSTSGNYTIGFWMRNVSENETLSGDVSGTGKLLTVIDFSRDNQQTFSESLLPTDDEWHYFVLTVDSTGNQELYMDNVSIASAPYSGGGFDGGSRLEALAFGALIVSDAASIKSPTEFNFELDDVTVWDAISTEVMDIHEEIWRFGSQTLVSGDYTDHANLLNHYSFDTQSNAMNYKEDVNYASGIPNIGIGYSTQTGTPTLIEDTGKPIQSVSVTIETEYGSDDVSPSVAESGFFSHASEQRFEAPEFVYIDRYGNELGTSDDDTTQFLSDAYYRARCVGFAVDGTDNQGTDRFFTIDSLGDDIAVIWQWELEYAIIVDMAVGNASGLSDALGNSSTVVDGVTFDGLGRKWASAGETITQSAIDGIIYAENNLGIGSGPRRYASTGVILENAPVATNSTADPNHYAQFDGEHGWLDGGDLGLTLADTDLTIEFWSRLDPSDTDSDLNIVSFGSVSSGGTQLRVGFRENSDRSFFVMANNNGSLTDISEVYTDNDWHHWASVYDHANSTVTVYRDGEEIYSDSATLSFTGDSYLYLGARIDGGTGESQFAGGIDNLRVWNAVRTEDEVAESMETQEYGSGQSDLVLEVTFDSPSLTALTSTEGSGFSFSYEDTDSLFAASVSSDAQLEALYPEVERSVFSSFDTRISVDDIAVNDWIRIAWQWETQYRINLQVASSAAGVASSTFLGQPFIDGDVTYDSNGYGWVPALSEVTVGVKYRTSDRCFTFEGTQGQLYAFSVINDNNLVDGTYDGVATRQFTFSELQGGGEITWTFGKTIFRAFVPLGESLDVSSTSALNLQLIPDLCDDGELHKSNGTPPVIFSNQDISVLQNGGTAGTLNKNIQWDSVGEQLLPLSLGEYRLEWQDANDPNQTHLIHIVSDFPTETYTVDWEIEDDDGYRLVEDDAFVFDYSMAQVASDFPANPTAHYRHIYDSDADKRPPTELDMSEADWWYFQGLSFSTGAVSVDDNTGEFDASTEGRTVLLYSYRPDPTEVANGDEGKEAFAVRIVESFGLEEVLYDGYIDALSSHHAEFDGTQYLKYGDTGDGSDQAATPALFGSDASDATLGFWFKASSTTANADTDRIIYSCFLYTNSPETSYGIAQIGFRSPNHATNPYGMYISYIDYTDSENPVVGHSYDITNFTQDFSWHHWTFATSGSVLEVHLDGESLIYINSSGLFDIPQDNPDGIQFGGSNLHGASCYGQIDNIRFWNRVLTDAEVQDSMSNVIPTLNAANLLQSFTFENTVTSNQMPNNGTATELTLQHDEGSILYDVSSFLVEQVNEGSAEVATRVFSSLDTAEFGSGYILNEVSNYNPVIYQRGVSVGTWGSIYPVNWSGLYTNEGVNTFDVAYYENPYFDDPIGETILHPNVAWPYVGLRYDDVQFPESGEHAQKRIYISSRLGSEGVDEAGVDQMVFDPASYEDLLIYNQPDPTAPGYNPNEEHAIVAGSIKDQLTGDTAYNLGQNAAFALQRSLNAWGENDSDTGTTENAADEFTSEPWVLVQYDNLDSGEMEMAAYKVELRRDGSGDVFPVLDSETNLPTDVFGSPVAQPTDPSYDFEYPTFAGDVHIPPYPLNLVIGSVIVGESWGGNIPSGFDYVRALWHDINGNAWTVAGDGQYFYRYWYPFRSDFWYEDVATGVDGDNDISVGTPMTWLPVDGKTFFEDGNSSTDGDTEPAQPVIVVWNTFWRDGYPVIKRGESLAYTGGEYFAENTGAEGLPALVAMAAAQIIYDSANATMSYSESNLEQYSARIVRGLDSYSIGFDAGDLPEELTPAFTDNIMVDGPRYYFKNLTGSLQKRFYYDSLNSLLIFRGRLNDLESGDPDLTDTPVSLYVLEPNVMTQSEYDSIIAMLTGLGISTGSTTFDDAVETLYLESQNPHELAFDDSSLNVDSTEQKFYSGFEAYEEASAQPGFYSVDTDAGTTSEKTYADLAAIISFWASLLAGEMVTVTADDVIPQFQPISSLGTGAILMTNPTLLTSEPTGADYITIAENNHEDAGGAVSLHIIQIGEERYRGAVKVIEAADVFSEKINIKHTGDFGGNTEDVYYQWWVRDVDTLDDVGLPAEDSASSDYDVEWQLYEEGLGINTIAFEGRPDITLADKLFYVRYANGSELNDITGEDNVVTNDLDAAFTSEESWRLVDINDSSDDYTRSGAGDLTDSTGDAIPFQWAGASNSPQLQSDGSYNFIPQLVMGWVKRVLDRINPYEARYSDFYNNESPATYSSQIQIAGGPYAGNVALNSDKDVIESVGLIELYETVLDRAKSLTLDIPGASTDGTNQAVLLAATRLAFLYELLAKEAYSDAQDSTVTVTSENGLSSVAPYVHAFQNQEASLLHEELALLRGTDFLKAYPAYNRLFWNYVKGEGEAAYNANYNIYDATSDGFINEFDGAELYPMGHGDAWGHFLSSNRMHYELLQSSAFDWESKAELYSLLDNVIEADYLDEKSFSRIAAAKARAGNEIVKATYREAYVEDPDGQWQGYEDVTEPTRAWGVSEWSKRAGQGAYFDWLVGNMLVPADADVADGDEVENLHQIDRITNGVELSEISNALFAIQQTQDEANRGYNPIGMDVDALTFDIDPVLYDGVGGDRQTHFEQVYNKAVKSAANALSAFEYASSSEADLRRIADDTEALQIEAFKQDLDFRNRLIAIFGTPYIGTIGPGEVYADGYEGPDTLLYKYIDRTTFDDFIPETDSRFTTLRDQTFTSWASDYSDLDWNLNYTSNNDKVSTLMDRYYLTSDFNDVVLGDEVEVDDESTTTRLSITAPVLDLGDYAFSVPDEDGDGEADWGSRTAYGRVQVQLNEMLLEQIALESSVRDYAAFIEQIELLAARLKQEMRAHEMRETTRSEIATLQIVSASVSAVASLVSAYTQWSWDFAWQASQVAAEFVPDVVGFSVDAGSVIEGSTETIGWGVRSSFYALWTGASLAKAIGDAGSALLEAQLDADQTLINEFREMNAIIAEMGILMTKEKSLRLAIAQQIKRLDNLALDYQSTVAEGFRLLDEREGFNIAMAGKTQRNRYSDMIYRLARNDALGKYEDAFDQAVRYAWLAAKAYDYETSLSVDSPYSAATLLEELVKTRTLGLWNSNGNPTIGQGGLAEVLAQLKANYDTLEGQLGINNPQVETGKLSLRHEHFRIRDDRSISDERWKSVLAESVVNLWDIPEFVTYCRPFASSSDGEQLGIVIEFDTLIESGLNVFGESLGGQDHAYSSANFATKLRSVGIWMESYNDAGLSTTPRVYLVPVGTDTLRVADSDEPTVRSWNVLEQRIPAPFVINDANLSDSGYIPSIDSIDGAFSDIRRFGDMRAYHDSGEDAVDIDQMVRDSRLIGRSAANSKWMLIIPGATLHSDPEFGLEKFIETISDIKLVFETYSHTGF